MKILVAEPLAEAGLELLKAQPGWDVIVSSAKEYTNHLSDAEVLLVRSAKVTAAELAQAPRLKVIGQAGIAVENIDLNAATAAGILVMNTPGGNAVSVAEITLGLMFRWRVPFRRPSRRPRADIGNVENFWGMSCAAKRLACSDSAASDAKWSAAPARLR